MKQIIRFWFLTMALLFMSMAGFALSFSYEGYTYTVNKDGETVTLKSGNGQENGVVLVPGYAYDAAGHKYPVTAIGQGAFSGFRGTKVIIGNYVTTIGENAFAKFAEKESNCVLVLGYNVTSIASKAFEKFGKTSENNKVIINCCAVPTINKETFKNVTNTTFFVYDEEAYSDFKSADVWKDFDSANNSKNVKYSWPFPYEIHVMSGLWYTAVFPIDMSEAEIAYFFGEGTKVAYLQSANFDCEKNEYHLHFEYTSSISANTPYLICASDIANFPVEADGDPFASSLTTSVPVDNKTGYQAQMIGVYSRYNLAENEFYLRSGRLQSPSRIAHGPQYTDDFDYYFYVASNDGTSFVNAGKCFFRILDDKGNVAAAKPSCTFGSGEATAIESVQSPQSRKGIYNLCGQYLGDDVKSLPRGIYVVNGKKLILR